MQMVDDVKREIRVALVLYGGVSLAVYEFGVTQCFFDLVREDPKPTGVFGLLLEMLQSTATVDVIAGTSAGGINGLLLGAALESGQDFSKLASLWRKEADVDRLLNNPGSPGAKSLLNGRYFLESLVKAFERLCETRDRKPHEYSKEMDIFLTGTDLEGYPRNFQDNLGNTIKDKDHRIVFHLKYRPGQESLGISRSKSEVDPTTQAEILAVIGRITASIPFAFEPVVLADLKPSLRNSLKSLIEFKANTWDSDMGNRFFVDGGILDNKPFGHALQTIFYRMPLGIVDRRLFFVEPDPAPCPDPIQELVSQDSADHPLESSYSPLNTSLTSLFKIPFHEGIADDLEKLVEHNHRVHWLREAKKEWLKMNKQRSFDPSLQGQYTLPYIKARLECVARSLVFHSEQAPSLKDFPSHQSQEEFHRRLLKTLDTYFNPNGTNSQDSYDIENKLDPYDVVFHLRRSFQLLYSIYDCLTEKPEDPGLRYVLVLLGRIILVQKTILKRVIQLRDEILTTFEKNSFDNARTETIFSHFRNFFHLNSAHWDPIRNVVSDSTLISTDILEHKKLFSDQEIQNLSKSLQGYNLSSKEEPAQESILSRLSEITRKIVSKHDDFPRWFDQFSWMDIEFYPLEFAAGIYELDEIEVVRISPADAQIKYSKGNPKAKITGDELAHFAAFMRRDWRSNDILQGRFDGINQIIQSLLTDVALFRIIEKSKGSWDTMMTPTELGERFFPEVRFSSPRIEELCQCWKDLCDKWAGLGSEEKKYYTELEFTNKSHRKTTEAVKSFQEKAQNFRDKLIELGQEIVLLENGKDLFSDLHFQDVKFGQKTSLHGSNVYSADSSIDLESEAWSNQILAGLSLEEMWEKIKDMSFGTQAIVGRGSKIPNSVIGEYVTRSYLLFWDMLYQSLGEKGRKILERGRVRLIFRSPMKFFNYLYSLARQNRNMMLVVIVALGCFLLGVGAQLFATKIWHYLGSVWVE